MNRQERALDRLQRLAAIGSPKAARVKAEAEYPQLPVRYRVPAAGKQIKGDSGSGRAGSSNGKHAPHPAVPGFRAKGYKCDPKLNPAVRDHE